MDIAMPTLDGLSALDEIRAVSPATAVVMYSCYDQPFFHAQAAARGAAAFVTKSESIESLTHTLHQAMTTSRPLHQTAGGRSAC
jgi:DNA-binding NarL/FixJ family response regulator